MIMVGGGKNTAVENLLKAEVVFPKASYKVGEMFIGGRYKLEYSGKPFFGAVVYRERKDGAPQEFFRVIAGEIKNGNLDLGLGQFRRPLAAFSVDESGFHENKNFFSSPGRYYYEISVYRCEDLGLQGNDCKTEVIAQSFLSGKAVLKSATGFVEIIGDPNQPALENSSSTAAILGVIGAGGNGSYLSGNSSVGISGQSSTTTNSSAGVSGTASGQSSAATNSPAGVSGQSSAITGSSTVASTEDVSNCGDDKECLAEYLAEFERNFAACRKTKGTVGLGVEAEYGLYRIYEILGVNNGFCEVKYWIINAPENIKNKSMICRYGDKDKTIQAVINLKNCSGELYDMVKPYLK